MRGIPLRNELRATGEMLPSHLTSLAELPGDCIFALFRIADRLRSSPETAGGLMHGKVLGTLFFQPSTRTRLNFEAAMARIGGTSTGFASADVTRAGDFYQETLEDVVAFTSQIVDIIALRHPRTGAARSAASVSAVPLISAGDGYHEHPTQGLGDIYAMQRLLGSVEGKSIGLLGDSSIRSLKSIVAGLAKLSVREIIFLPPAPDTLDAASIEILKKYNTPFRFVTHIRELVEACDLVETIGYRHPNHNLDRDVPVAEVTPERFRVSLPLLGRSGCPPILHPGPRTDEIDPEVDNHPSARYFEQATHGMWMRAALLGCFLARSQ